MNSFYFTPLNFRDVTAGFSPVCRFFGQVWKKEKLMEIEKMLKTVEKSILDRGSRYLQTFSSESSLIPALIQSIVQVE